MPHDKFGRVINVGDEVIVRFKVEQVSTGEEYCNVQIKSIETMPPYPDSFIVLSAVNTKQCEKVDNVQRNLYPM
jgi:hypothetical protein